MQDEFIDDQPPVGTLTPEARESLRRAMADTPATHPDKIAPMNTPITDAALDKWACGGTSSETIIPAMRRLELDRAALMDALCEIHILSYDYSGEGSIALKAIEAARANFPEQ
jgi:hypothetical protein